ncbi:MAG TPA: hypothetical protein VHA75_14065, partial [Rugosimonospora sp.]|nr:hypothetical protein [Rugosimonospora sp.]
MPADEIRSRGAANVACALAALPVLAVATALLTAYQSPDGSPLPWANLVLLGGVSLSVALRRLAGWRDRPARLVIVPGGEPAFVAPARYGYGFTCWYAWLFVVPAAVLLTDRLRAPHGWVSGHPITAALHYAIALCCACCGAYGTIGLWRGRARVRLLPKRLEVRDHYGATVVPWDAFDPDASPWTDEPLGRGAPIQRYPVARPEPATFRSGLPRLAFLSRG